jgi:hypothetical protein
MFGQIVFKTTPTDDEYYQTVNTLKSNSPLRRGSNLVAIIPTGSTCLK